MALSVEAEGKKEGTSRRKWKKWKSEEGKKKKKLIEKSEVESQGICGTTMEFLWTEMKKY